MRRTDHILETIQQYGQSFYFYDLDAFEAHLKHIRETLHPDIKVWYACKANPLSNVLSLLRKNGFGADVASLGELQQARTAGFGAQELIATGPAKSKAYLASLLQAKVKCIIIESINQLRDLNELCLKLNLKQDVLLRVQLDWNGSDKSVLGGSDITPFGLGTEDWKTVNLSIYKQVNVVGLHSFQWGNVLEIGKLKSLWEYTIQQCKKLAYDMNIELKVLDLGGGLGLSYKDDRELSFTEVHALLLELKKEFELNEVWLELGRFSIGKFGSYFTRIVDMKSVRGKNLIITEGGINHIARPALVGESFPCFVFNRDHEEKKTYAVHGPLCTALDKLGEFDLPSTVQVGDWLEFKRAGAYGFSESMPYFLCHNLVGEAVLHKGELHMPRRPKTNLEWMV